MQNETNIIQYTSSKNNSLAVTSIATGLGGWALWIIAVITSWIPFINICTGTLSCLSPISWIVAIISGHTSKKQLATSAESGNQLAIIGLISGYVGLGIVLLSLCATIFIITLAIAGVAGIELLENIN